MKKTIILFLFGISFIFHGCNSNIEKAVEIDSIDDIDTTLSSLDLPSESLVLKEAPPEPVFVHGTYPTFFQELITKDLQIDQDAPQKLKLDKRYPYRGAVYLQEKGFSGSNVPFVCYVTDEIRSLYVDGVKRSFTPNKEFFFRQTIDLYIGYNRIPIKITNKAGHVSESYIEITMEQISN